MNRDPFQLRPDMDITTFYKTISAKGKAAMEERRTRGEQMHLAPLGYLNVRDDEGRSITIPDPRTHELVEKAKALRASGCSIRSICRSMMKKGLRSRRGNVIGPSSMLKIVSRQEVA